jgi:biopolymer transport protein ExbD
MGSDILPILDTLRQAGAKNLDLRLTDPPQDATVPTRHIRVMQVSLMAREGFPLSLKVHPEVSLNNRAMPLEGASIELQRRLRSSFPKTARVVVSPEATWQGVVEAADVVRQAGGTVLLVGEGTP